MSKGEGRIGKLPDRNNEMIFLGKVEACSICGKRKKIGRQRIEVISNNRHVDVYLECKDCAVIPL
jgi:hypothetical protein